MTEPIAIYHHYGEAIAYACGKCHTWIGLPIHQGSHEERCAVAQEEARTHCGPWHCGCGAERERYLTLCSDCYGSKKAQADAEREAELLAKARHVALDDYEGDMLYLEGRDKYVTPDGLRDMIADGDAPEYAWACDEIEFSLDAANILESALEDHHEDAGSSIRTKDVEELQAILDEWVRECASRVKSYTPDHSTCVLLATKPNRV